MSAGLSLGDLTLVELALVQLSQGVDENTDLGRQIYEAIAKVDQTIAAVRAEVDTQTAAAEQAPSVPEPPAPA